MRLGFREPTSRGIPPTSRPHFGIRDATREAAVLGWDHICQKLFEERVRELSVSTEGKLLYCWKRLLFRWPKNGQDTGPFSEFIDCAFKTLSDHIDAVDWICRDIWRSGGLAITEEFVQEILRRKLAEQIAAHTSELDKKLTRLMHRKTFENRSPIVHSYERAKKQLSDKVLVLCNAGVGIPGHCEAGTEHAHDLSGMTLPSRQEAGQSSELSPEETVADRHDNAIRENEAPPARNAREAFVLPILEEKGWSVHRFSVEAELDFHTVNDYLKEKTKPNRSTRKQLADALGIPVTKLPH
jgi:lambda repressor-like predicted transcriptional regulator